MKKKIFIVEDDADIRKNLRDLMADEGYPVDVAPDGREGLALLRSANELPSLILLDLMMPVMDGFQFRKEQESDPRLANIPVVIMTADGHIEAKRFRVGAVSFLRKPVELNEVIATVEKYCGV